MVLKKTKTAVKWAAPGLFKPDLESQLESAMKRKEIKTAYKNFKGTSEEFKDLLKSYIHEENQRNYKLMKTANFIDSFNKATMPIDGALDYLNFMGGIGFAANGIKLLATAPGYLAYDLYYLGKTGDLVGTLKNIGYEGLSFISWGALPHLLNNYTRQAEKHSIKKGSERFLEKINSKNISIQQYKKSGSLEEELTKAA